LRDSSAEALAWTGQTIAPKVDSTASIFNQRVRNSMDALIA
jgi:hypothetical protein